MNVSLDGWIMKLVYRNPPLRILIVCVQGAEGERKTTATRTGKGREKAQATGRRKETKRGRGKEKKGWKGKSCKEGTAIILN